MRQAFIKAVKLMADPLQSLLGNRPPIHSFPSKCGEVVLHSAPLGSALAYHTVKGRIDL